MAQMIRKQVYIEPLQDVNLKRQAKKLGITEAEIMRRAIDRQMAFLVPGLRDLQPGNGKRPLLLNEWPENLFPVVENSGGKKPTKRD